MIYQLLKPLLFTLNPEISHIISLEGLKAVNRLGIKHFTPFQSSPKQLMGLSFPNPVGLAAGLDKNAEYVDALAMLGFGFIEVGTVTPKPQNGNPKPRLFRLLKDEAIINRMGFNNKGIEYVARKLASCSYKGILGINIGKNKDTPLDKAIDDYLMGFRYLADFASYITINISSPNTPGLRDLQQQDFLIPLLSSLKLAQAQYVSTHQKYVPIVVKISPDVAFHELASLANVFLQQKIDGVIATNTTVSRPMLKETHYAKEQGGLSGKPLLTLSSQILLNLHQLLKGKIPIIASGGITQKHHAREKVDSGASLVQIYSGLIYQGPALIKGCLSVL